MSANVVFKYIYSSLRVLGVLTFFALSVANQEAPDYKNIFRSQQEQALVDYEDASKIWILAQRSGSVEFESYSGGIELPVQK